MSAELWLGVERDILAECARQKRTPDGMFNTGGFAASSVSRFVGISTPPTEAGRVDLSAPEDANGRAEWWLSDGGVAYPETSLVAVRFDA